MPVLSSSCVISNWSSDMAKTQLDFRMLLMPAAHWSQFGKTGVWHRLRSKDESEFGFWGGQRSCRATACNATVRFLLRFFFPSCSVEIYMKKNNWQTKQKQKELMALIWQRKQKGKREGASTGHGAAWEHGENTPIGYWCSCDRTALFTQTKTKNSLIRIRVN